MEKPDISTEPFEPRTDIEPSKSFGLAPTVTSKDPIDPFLKRMLATKVSSCSIFLTT
jgi:hypothetical protein